MNTEIKCGTEDCQTLSSQDAPITNNTGADLVQGNVYVLDKIFAIAGLNTVGDPAADGEISNFWTKVPVAKVVKATGGVWKRGDKIFYNFATNEYDNIPRLVIPTPPTYDVGTDVKLNFSINGLAAVIGTIAPSVATAVTTAEMLIGLASAAGVTSAALTDLDGNSIAYGIGAVGSTLKATLGTNTDWTVFGLAAGDFAQHVGIALSDELTGSEEGYIDFNGLGN